MARMRRIFWIRRVMIALSFGSELDAAKGLTGVSTRQPPSGRQQHGSPQQAASAQHASAKDDGLAAKATPGVSSAEAARILVMNFMSILQNLVVIEVDARAHGEEAEPAFQRSVRENGEADGPAIRRRVDWRWLAEPR